MTSSESKIEELKQKVKVMDDALKSNSLQFATSENSRKTLEMKAKKYEEQIALLENALVS